MYDLLPHYDNMDKDTVIEYLTLVAEKASGWNDSKKYPFWKEFLRQKDWLIHNMAEELDDFVICGHNQYLWYYCGTV